MNTWGFVLFTSLFPSVLAIIQGSVLASQYSLTTSTSLPFPKATLSSSDTQSSIVSDWSLSKGRIQDEADDLAFVLDPFTNSSSDPSSPVLQVTYPAGSYSHNTGGAQFENLWNTSDDSPFQSMILSALPPMVGCVNPDPSRLRGRLRQRLQLGQGRQVARLERRL